MNCITCDFEHQEKYCPNCGEKSDTKKITLRSIIEDSFSSITNMDKGLLFNVKSLLLNPRKIVTDYVSGKRKGILNPISFLILSITLYLIVITFFKASKEVIDDTDVSKSHLQKVGNEVGFFIRTNLKFFWILSIIPLALSLKLFFKKYNYFEHLAISSFIIGQVTLFAVISYLAFRYPLIFDPVVYLIIIWLVYKIFKNKNDKVESIFISIGTLVVFIIQLILIITLIGLVKYYC